MKHRFGILLIIMMMPSLLATAAGAEQVGGDASSSGPLVINAGRMTSFGDVQSISAVSCVSPFQVWISGPNEQIFRSSDGGSSWTRLASPLPSDEEVSDIEFISPTTGWAIGANNAIMRSTNGGSTWSSQSYEDSLYPPYLLALSAVDSSHAWIGGYYRTGAWGDYYHNVILRTTDGVNWTMDGATAADGATDWGVVGLDFADRDHGWAVVEGGGMMRSSSGGAGWTPPFYFTEISLSSSSDISFADASNGWAVGQNTWSGGTIMHTSDGRTWYDQSDHVQGLDQLPAVTAVSAVSPSVAWAVCEEGYILETVDAGRTWYYAHPTTADFNDLDFIAEDVGYAVTDTGDVHRWGPPYTPPPTAAKPILSRISPTKGRVNDIVELRGRNFGAKRGESYVKFGRTKAIRYIWGKNSILCKVPRGTPKGTVKVVVVTPAGSSGAKRFVRK